MPGAHPHAPTLPDPRGFPLPGGRGWREAPGEGAPVTRLAHRSAPPLERAHPHPGCCASDPLPPGRGWGRLAPMGSARGRAGRCGKTPGGGVGRPRTPKLYTNMEPEGVPGPLPSAPVGVSVPAEPRAPARPGGPGTAAICVRSGPTLQCGSLPRGPAPYGDRGHSSVLVRSGWAFWAEDLVGCDRRRPRLCRFGLSSLRGAFPSAAGADPHPASARRLASAPLGGWGHQTHSPA